MIYRLHPINNTLSMFYSMYEVNKLKCEYEENHKLKYDCTFRMRPDIMFYEPIKGYGSYDLSGINVRNENSHTEYAINDQFAFGNSEVMDRYSNVINNIVALYEKGCVINPECLLGYNASSYSGDKIFKHDFNFCLWRDFKGE